MANRSKRTGSISADSKRKRGSEMRPAQVKKVASAKKDATVKSAGSSSQPAIGKLAKRSDQLNRSGLNVEAEAFVTSIKEVLAGPEDDPAAKAGDLPESLGAKAEPGKERTALEGMLDAYIRSSALHSIPVRSFAATRGFDFSRWQDSVRAVSRGAEFKAEISQLRSQVAEKVKDLEAERASGQEKEKTNAELRSLLAEAQAKDELGFLLARVNAAAQEKLLAGSNILEKLRDGEVCDAFVMSVDIRRSTELMLKARTPQLFAEFLSTLCKKLFDCVIKNFGVFDKFTGDGILAFFPKTFAGEDACYYAIRAAEGCHEAFAECYRSSRSSFSSILKDGGLGIGIDFGSVRLLRVAEGLTVVGIPVVYACRLSAAPPGVTLLNQPAYEEAESAHRSRCRFDEVSLAIKHEGEVVAYRVSIDRVPYSPAMPGWVEE